MPIPKPKDSENKEEYTKRCVADPLMVSEYSEEQRFAVCSTTWENKDKLLDKPMETKSKTIHVNGKILKDEKGIKTVLTREMMDREGEMVVIDGIDISKFVKNPVLIDSHNMNGSVVDNVLGRVENLFVRFVEGAKELVGDLIFANTPRAQLAKSLVEDGFVKAVSMGFGVPMDGYDMETGMINKSELYELSLVSVPANIGALIGKSFKGDENTEIIKMLKNYGDIKPKMKEYRRLFLDDKLCEKLKYTKTGDELIDIKGIYDIFCKSIEPVEEAKGQVETPQVQEEVSKVENQPETQPITAEDIAQIVRESVDKHFQQA